jgi:3',5'-cyclic AMP phosphodiesterase CpdA
MWEKLGGNTRAFRNWIRRQGFEPGTHHRDERVDDLVSDSWRSSVPIVDIRHDNNLTPNRWSIDQFRNKPKEWIESDNGVPGWDKLEMLENG